VAIGRRDDAGGPVPYVGGDYVSGTRALVAEARELGHRRLAYVGPSAGPESTVDRWRGFSGALGKGVALAAHVPSAGQAPSEILAAIRAADATAVFFTELADAIGVHSLARKQGLAVPRDLSMIVTGSHIRAERTGIRFTSFNIPREEMGRLATAALVRRIETGGGPAEQILLACDPLSGETLGPNPASRPSGGRHRRRVSA
jgi:DNA-binding LacI/PurR family transcriptional regulator